MRAYRKRSRLDENSAPPFSLLLNEWWDSRKSELAKLNRLQLERRLDELNLPIPPSDVSPSMRNLWMRLRIARAEQIIFHEERGVAVPTSMILISHSMDEHPGLLPPWSVNIFYGAKEENLDR